MTARPAAVAAGLRVSATARLGDHADAWDDLVEAAPLPSPFLRSWWLEAMAEASTRATPVFALVLEGDRLLGGLALQERRRAGLAVLEFLGAGPLSPDHLDLVALPGAEAAVAAELGRWLRGRGPALLDLDGAADTHRLGPVLGPRAWVTVTEEAPFVRLPADYASYLAGIAPIMRNSIRRSGNKLGRRGDLQSRFVPAEDLAPALSRLLTLHRGQWGEDAGLEREFSAFSAAAHAGHARGELQVLELRVGEEVAAVDVVLTVCGRMSMYTGGRDLDDRFSGAGTVSMARAISQAIEQEASEVDFLRGTEPYKEQWAAGHRRLLRLRAGTALGGQAVLRAIQLREAPATRAVARRVRALVPAGLPGASAPEQKA